MTSALAERLVGAQRPRVCQIPDYVSSSGKEAIEVAEFAGLELDDWQQFVLTNALGEKPDGSWAAKTVGLMVSRQNGKGALLEARELVGLFLLEEDYVIHSAQLFDTAWVHFNRLAQRIEESPVLSSRVAKITRGHGKESITLKRKNGREPRLEIRTRTGMGGLGFSINMLVMDEAMIISEEMLQALLPTLSAMENVQVWYTGSAVDQQNPAHQGVPFARVRERGLRGDPSVMYCEWSLDLDDPEKLPDDVDDQLLAETNPGLGIRLSRDYIRGDELAGMGKRGAAVQRYGVGDWPRTDGLEDKAITPEQWAACIEKDSKPQDPVCFAFDITPDRSKASVVVAGFRSDGKSHVEIVEQRRHAKWIPDFVAGLLERHERSMLVTDASALDSSLLTDFEKLNIRFGEHEKGLLTNATEMARACAMLYDAVEQKTLRHLGEPALSDAIRCAVKRPLSDAWAWSRKDTAGDISPLVAVTLAHWGLQQMELGQPKFIDWREL